MARETKVGLLAGLAFIVGFAIILTNQGQRGSRANLASGTNQREAFQSDANRPSLRKSSKTRTRAHAGRGASQRSDRSTIRPSPARSTSPQRSRTYRANQVGIARTRQPRETRAGQGSKPADVSIQTNLAGRTQPQRTPSQADRRSTVSSATSPQRGSRQSNDNNLRQLELRIAQLTNELESAKKEASPSGHQRVGRSSASVRNQRASVGAVKSSHQSTPGSLKYVVVAGDTLSKIAKTYYGHGSKRYIDQIIGANRNVLTNPNVVRVGDKLSLPGVPVVKVSSVRKTWRKNPTQMTAAKRKVDRANRTKSANRTRSVKPANRTNKKGSTPAAWKWYEIKKDDRYISIAREQLGDAKRWPEIHELNKEKFSDPSRIRVGVRIKLPTITLARATQERSH